MKNEITFIDPFAGIGGFRYGLEKANDTITERTQQGVQQGSKNNPTTIKSFLGTKQFTCVWSNEWDKYCAKIYEKNFGERPDTRDIRTIPSREIPDHDLLCAGFPCPTFSIAGKGKGFEDTRGAVFFEIPRILRDKRPRYFLLENVKGLLSHQAGQTFQTILGVLSNLGYRCEWQVLNSQNFGVPQNRERVFIVGHLGEATGSEIFPLEQSDKANNTNYETANCLDANYHKGWLDHGQRTMVIHDKRQARELRVQKEPCVTKHYGTGGGNVPLVVNTVDCDGYLRQMGVHHDKPLRHYRIRRLTPIECERLQGFPDNWTKGVSNTQRYKMLGNAVTVNVVEAIGKRMRKVLDEE